jgi:hypothetical protein
MIRRYEFVEKTICLIRERLEKSLPDDASIDKMILKRDKILYKFMKEEVK